MTSNTHLDSSVTLLTQPISILEWHIGTTSTPWALWAWRVTGSKATTEVLCER